MVSMDNHCNISLNKCQYFFCKTFLKLFKLQICFIFVIRDVFLQVFAALKRMQKRHGNPK